ncbi:hypothetical protein Sango_2430800 [Sesamum angolense]|uniref:Retrotransposon Copia-like N-terminal domain-containing protein n=1 Tax=Sesamum angolense TaxID=2727404 RepID=A0AAE1W7N8_9LAMI|nr:hypothetical protein Sango_2430800 [Sesamum angolense]
MSLVYVPLDGNNYLTWSTVIRLAIREKLKLGFIDGKCERSTTNSDNFEQWQRVDYMVVSWLLNSISKDIVEAFTYTTLARDLWLELEAHFGESNVHLLNQIQREISTLTQGDMSVTAYFTKLKILWDELVCLNPLPTYSCGASRILAEQKSSRQLIQFLIELSTTYQHV